MPKNNVSDPITGQEMAFARLVLSGTMTDRHAAEAVGMNPGSAAYTKSKPRVRAYMLELRAAGQQQLAQQEAEAQHRRSFDREQVLDRLWAIANLSPERTRGSITGQIKALSMIVAMQSFSLNPLAALTEKDPAPTPPRPQMYVPAWLAERQAAAAAPQPQPQTTPAPAQQEASPTVPDPKVVPRLGEEVTPDRAPSPSTVDPHFSPAPPKPPAPFVPLLTSVPDARAPFSINKNPFTRRR